MTEHQRQHAAIRAFLEAAALGDRDAYVASLEALDWPTAWHEIFRAVVALGRVHPNTRLVFADQWRGYLGEFTNYPPAGCRFRTLFADHLGLLVDGLRLLVPPLLGDAPAVLFRGQSAAEHESGIVGLSWTPYPTTAEFYARDPVLNPGPAVVLAKFLPGEAIIGEIGDGEILLDPHRVGSTQKIEVPGNKLGSVDAARYLEFMEDLQPNAPVVLYRGQSQADYERGVVGEWWTPYPRFAEIFARSFIRDHLGPRVILAAINPGRAIVRRVNDEQIVVDPAKLDRIELIASPPPYTAEQEDMDPNATSILDRVPHGYAHEAVREWMARTFAEKTEAVAA